ncbi:MAG: (d)CMP kinase [Dehalococcoidia bacterium]
MTTTVRGPIAIDGDAASGKTTVGRELARRFGFTVLDTGRMYRAFTLAAQRAGIAPDDAQGCAELAARLDMAVSPGPNETRIALDGADVSDLLDAPVVEASVSAYAKIAAVRAKLVARQRALAVGGALVVIGRDIGTVVLPDAPAKLFLVAAQDVQAARRASQNGLTVEAARANVALRNTTDRTRTTSPTAKAPDAHEIDTSFVGVAAVVAEALAFVEARLGGGADGGRELPYRARTFPG